MEKDFEHQIYEIFGTTDLEELRQISRLINKNIKEMNLPFYDPLLIIEKTQGYMEGDHQWIMILRKDDGI